jgi:MMP 1-O-methyltransferase
MKPLSTILHGTFRFRTKHLKLASSPNMGEIKEFLETVPGMISVESCILHMVICSTQVVRGDVIEIGAWQGRNSIALALGCKESANGKLTVIDHFKGNPGKERFYRISKKDLSDVFDGFLSNIARSGLTNEVRTFAGRREEFDKKLAVRLLFIDGNHDYEAVKADIAHFYPMLVPGAIVILDDYSEEFPGVIRAAAEFMKENEYATSIILGRSLVIKT